MKAYDSRSTRRVVLITLLFALAAVCWAKQNQTAHEVRRICHIIQVERVDSPRPIGLANGWYYIPGGTTNNIPTLMLFATSRMSEGDIERIIPITKYGKNYSNGHVDTVLKKVADRLRLDKGYFIYISIGN